MIAYPLETSFYFKRKLIKLNLAFDVVLRFFDLQNDENLDSATKLELSVQMLIKNYNKIKKFSSNDKVELLRQIMDEFINIKSKSTGDDTKVVDFNQDSRYIFASFMQAYGIDLVEQQNKLDWRKFISLFQGLPEGTKIREVMEIRAKKYPTPNKYNSEEIAGLRKAKAFYALDVSKEESEKQFQKALDRFASMLEQRATKGGEKNG